MNYMNSELKRRKAIVTESTARPAVAGGCGNATANRTDLFKVQQEQ